MLEGKVIIVTSSGRGIGEGCAKVFATDGAKVVVSDVNVQDSEETVKDIRKAGGEAIFSVLTLRPRTMSRR